jgi:23S rRNA (adenine2503-C2)-methyltransferase
MTEEKINFKSCSRQERKDILKEMGQPSFREKQVFQWISRGALSFDEMTDLPKDLRSRLFEAYRFESASVELVQRSKDGTRKYLLKMTDGNFVEAVFMKYEYGNTLCISTQIGCNMGCVFCASGIGGKIRNLEGWEMLDEYLICRKDAGEDINHVVLMGMGEPFDNYDNVSEFLRLIHDPDGVGLSYRNITVSTSGLIKGIKKFSEDFPQVNLAISLHAATQDERQELMPVAKSNRLEDLIETCREVSEKTGRRITFEYALIAGKNDRDEDVKKLSSLLKGMLCHVNLIPLNPVIENGMKGSGRDAAKFFADKLEKAGIPATVRRSLGQDIDAACGQLRKKHT